jgi:hypothetical protein
VERRRAVSARDGRDHVPLLPTEHDRPVGHVPLGGRPSKPRAGAVPRPLRRGDSRSFVEVMCVPGLSRKSFRAARPVSPPRAGLSQESDSRSGESAILRCRTTSPPYIPSAEGFAHGGSEQQGARRGPWHGAEPVSGSRRFR